MNKYIINCLLDSSRELNRSVYSVLNESLDGDWSHEPIFTLDKFEQNIFNIIDLTSSLVTLLPLEICWTFLTDTSHTVGTFASNQSEFTFNPYLSIAPKASIRLIMSKNYDKYESLPEYLSLFVHNPLEPLDPTSISDATVFTDYLLNSRQAGGVFLEYFFDYHTYEKSKCNNLVPCKEYSPHSPGRVNSVDWQCPMNSDNQLICYTAKDCERNIYQLATIQRNGCISAKQVGRGISVAQLMTQQFTYNITGCKFDFKNKPNTFAYANLMENNLNNAYLMCAPECYFNIYNIQQPDKRMYKNEQGAPVDADLGRNMIWFGLHKKPKGFFLTIEYYPTMTNIQFLCNVASLLGMWTGFTVLTLFELSSKLFVKLAHLLKQMSKTTKNNNNNILQINQFNSYSSIQRPVTRRGRNTVIPNICILNENN